MNSVWIASLLVALATNSFSEESSQFVSATPVNTTLADGSVLPPKEAGWKWIAEVGNGGVGESQSGAQTPIPRLMIMAKNLKPGQTYEVFGGFWADDGSNPNVKRDKLLPAGFGLTLASMHYFAGEKSAQAPWIVAPAHGMGEAFGIKAFIGGVDSFPKLNDFKVTEEGRKLVFAQLGVTRAAKDGTLPVFVSSFPTSGGGRTVVDGVVIRAVAGDQAESQAMNPKVILHLAIRSGDQVTLRRAIADGADVNSLDEEGLTPLFYASASGDASIVKLLLDHRADPNVIDQSITPLTAAAIVPSEEITDMLLQAGAKVRPTAYEHSGKLHMNLDPRFIHPIIAAIRSGSLPIVRKLAAQVPDLRIESLVPKLEEVDALNMQPRYIFDIKEFKPMPFLVAGAVGSGHWDLAVWLLDHGCKPVVPYPNSFYVSDGNEHPYVNLMVWAVVAGDEGLPFLNAMIRHGYSPVLQREFRPSLRESSYKCNLFPWDALSAACLVGNTSLIAKFLPLASDLDAVTQERLVSLAMYSGNVDALKLLTNQFPKAAPPRLGLNKKSEGTSQDPDEDKVLRLLLPRTKARPVNPKTDDKGTMVMAVISSPEASGPGDALAAFASVGETWSVVDRDEVEAALAEKNHIKPWADGTHQLSDLGDKLAADVMVIVSKLAGNSLSLYRFEAVEVATGLEVHREYMNEKEMKLEADLKSFLERTQEAMQMARMHERKQAVTLIAFTASESIPNSGMLARSLKSAVLAKIDETPGMISLTRSQSGRLVQEQALTGSQSVWAASHLVEAAIRPAENGLITVALRLNTLQAGKNTQRDTEATGAISELAELAAKAWSEAVGSSGDVAQVPAADEKEKKKHAQLEALRIVREIEWMMSYGMDPSEILPMIESASALGAPSEKIIPLHLDCLFRKTGVFDPFPMGYARFVTSLSEIQLSNIIESLPVPVIYSDRIVKNLPAFNELAQQTEYYLQRGGVDGVNHDPRSFPNYGYFANQEFWYVIKFLSFVRAAVYTNTLTEPQRIEFESFARELDSITRLYFELLNKSVQGKRKASISLEKPDKYILKNNPELLKGLALALRSPRINVDINYSDSSDTNLCRRFDLYSWQNPQRLIAKMILEQMPPKETEYDTQITLMAQCLMADSTERPKIFRSLIMERSKMQSVALKPQPKSSSMEMLLNDYTFGTYFDGFKSIMPIHHGNKVLPHLIHNPYPCPEYLMNYSMYNSLFRFDASLPAIWREGGVKTQNFRELLDGKAKKFLAEGKKDSIKDLYAASLNWEMVSGESVAASFAQKYKSYLGMQSDEKSLDAKLVVDLRTVDKNANGFFYQVQKDLANPSHLWLHFQPYEGKVIPMDDYGDGTKDLLRRKPWLIGIDSRDYKMKNVINLAQADGMSEKQNLPGWSIRYNFSYLVQSRDKFISNAYWVLPNEEADNRVSIVIDKNNGSIKRMPNDLSIHHNNAVSLNNEFYILHEDKTKWKKGGIYSPSVSLYNINSREEIQQLTEYGRRPELTPFDSEDLCPENLGVRGKNVFVGSSRDYFGEYNPIDRTWKMLPAETEQQRNVFWEVTQSDPKIGNEIISSSGGWMINRDELSVGALNFKHPKRGEKQIFVNLGIPDDFLNGIKYASQGARNEKAQSYDIKILDHSDHVKTQPLHLFVVSQTDDKLVLALQFNNRNLYLNRFIPFLWEVPKKEIIDILNR